MRRADRLFEIIQVLRRASRPMTAEAIAAELETGKRTIYRDIAALMARRVPIRGEAGVGYVLEPGFDLPPLMLTTDEVEAITLGAQWVIARADAGLARAASNVLAKVSAIVPEELRPFMDDPAVGTPDPRTATGETGIDVGRLREWGRRGRKIEIDYGDDGGVATKRVVWPFMVGYLASVTVLMAWCELRGDFRIFRTDRISEIRYLDFSYPEHSVVLRWRWLATVRRKKIGSACGNASLTVRALDGD